MELARVRAPFAVLTGTATVVMGVVLAVGGLALMLAVVSTPQPAAQLITASILLCAGLVDLRSSRGVWRHERGALILSGLATLILVAYLGALRDFGELFWLNVLLLFLLAASAAKATR
jgi:hypothetical protein